MLTLSLMVLWQTLDVYHTDLDLGRVKKGFKIVPWDLREVTRKVTCSGDLPVVRVELCANAVRAFIFHHFPPTSHVRSGAKGKTGLTWSMKIEAQKMSRLDKRRNTCHGSNPVFYFYVFGIYHIGPQAEFGFTFSINVDVPESSQVDFRCTDKAEDFY